jgi:predicted porin
MKKSLIALAVLGLSGVAMAQSSVTLYGVADAALVKNSGQKTQMGSGAPSLMTNGDSRLGVMGTEDLGGGLRVGFNFENRFSLEDGSIIGKNKAAGFWSPMAKMWVTGNWGTFSMGRTLTPSFYGMSAWELTGAANYTLYGSTYGWGGANPRNDSQFTYKTPNLSGFTAELGYITKPDVQTFLANPAAGAKWDLSLVYANGPLTASFVANKEQTYKKTNWGLGGRYKFGTSFIVAASYTSAYNVATPAALSAALGSGYARRAGFTIGGTALFGPFSVTLDLARDTKNQINLGINNKKYTNVLLEGKYALSKRTFVYAAYLRFDNKNNYGLGLRHNF